MDVVRISTREFRKHLAEEINQVAKGKDVSIITKNGKDRAVLIGVDNLRELLRHNPSAHKTLAEENGQSE